MRIPRKLTTAVFSAAVAASLGFGATQASSQASSPASDEQAACPFFPPLLVGSTTNEQTCASRCASYGMPNSAWDPESTCCSCPD